MCKMMGRPSHLPSGLCSILFDVEQKNVTIRFIAKQEGTLSTDTAWAITSSGGG
jgi:hypothetical protein